ncbi:hypothetical protein BUC_2054 [Burkholderia pseudomallei 576]|nr:hypothetical protein BUC_2054 [Burkholderia pseudomallei 576]
MCIGKILEKSLKFKRYFAKRTNFTSADARRRPIHFTTPSKWNLTLSDHTRISTNVNLVAADSAWSTHGFRPIRPSWQMGRGDG